MTSTRHLAAIRLNAARRRDLAARLARAEDGERVPPDAALDAILAYEPHLRRQVSAALDQLEKVRMLRKTVGGRSPNGSGAPREGLAVGGIS